MNNADIQKLMNESSGEIMSSLQSLMEKHGADKVMFATALVNCPKVLRMLKEEGVSDSVVRLIDAQMRMMMICWGNAAGYGADVQKIADGIREQSAMFENELTEAVEPAEGGSTTTKEQ